MTGVTSRCGPPQKSHLLDCDPRGKGTADFPKDSEPRRRLPLLDEPGPPSDQKAALASVRKAADEDGMWLGAGQRGLWTLISPSEPQNAPGTGTPLHAPPSHTVGQRTVNFGEISEPPWAGGGK